MSEKLDYQEIMWAEQKPDVYAGPNCDEHRARWWIYADGDKQGDWDSRLSLIANGFPPGTKVTVSVPCCPTCKLDAQMCAETGGCDFDWQKWAEDRYS